MAPSTTKNERLRYSEDSMTAACASVSKGMKLREAARTHGVPYPTLRARVNGRSSIRQTDRTVLSREQEKRLTNWLTESSRHGFGPTKQQLLSRVQKCLNTNEETTVFKDNMPGEKWYRLFCQRHQDKLSLQTPKALGSQRAAVSESKIITWFKQTQEDIDQVDATVLECPERLFHCGESGFQLGGGVKKVLTAKVDKRVYQGTNDTYKQVTVLVCGNALGELQAPLLIFPGQRFSYDPLEGFKEAQMAKSVNGLIDSEIFAKWMESAFCPAVAHLKKPVILFVDGHSTDLTLEVNDICRANGIVLHQLPSHSTRIIQPPGLTSFKNLKHAWSEEVMRYQEENSDTLSKQHFAKVFKRAWDRRGHDGEVLASGFSASGIFPWNPERFDRSKLAPHSHRMFQTVQTDDSTVTEETSGPIVKELTYDTTTAELTSEPAMTEVTINKLTMTGHVSELTVTVTDVPMEVEQTELNLPITGAATDSDYGQSAPSAASSVNNMTVQSAFDRLLHLAACAGSSGLVHYMTCYDMDLTTDEPEQQLFSKLYGHIKTQLETGLTDTDDTKKDKTANKQTFDHLPLPTRWDKNKRTIKDPPKMVSSDAVKIFKENLETKKRDEEEEKRKKEKKKNQIESEDRIKLKEQQKREREEQIKEQQKREREEKIKEQQKRERGEKIKEQQKREGKCKKEKVKKQNERNEKRTKKQTTSEHSGTDRLFLN